MAKHLEQGSNEEIAAAVLADDRIRDEIIHRLSQTVSKECKQLCSAKIPNTLQRTSCSDLQQFDITNLVTELHMRVPTLQSMVDAATTSNRQQDQRLKTPQRHALIAACAVAILLKERSERMSAFQYIIGLILYRGGVPQPKLLKGPPAWASLLLEELF